MSSVMNGLQGLDDPQVAAAAEHASRVLQALSNCNRHPDLPLISTHRTLDLVEKLLILREVEIAKRSIDSFDLFPSPRHGQRRRAA